MNAEELRHTLERHRKWLNCEEGGEHACLHGANLCGADLRYANLLGADLDGANLCYADLDYSCWPLWCGSLDVIVDKRIAAQMAYHFCRLVCDDLEVIAAQNALIPLANQFHRVKECGKIQEKAPQGAANTEEAQKKNNATSL